MPLWAMLLIIMTISAVLSAVINNAATAVLMAPIAVSGQFTGRQFRCLPDGGRRRRIECVPDADRSSIEPAGDGPGGYRFGDYWR